MDGRTLGLRELPQISQDVWQLHNQVASILGLVKEGQGNFPEGKESSLG